METVGGAETEKVGTVYIGVVLRYLWREQNNRVVAGMGDGAKRKVYIVCTGENFVCFCNRHLFAVGNNPVEGD